MNSYMKNEKWKLEGNIFYIMKLMQISRIYLKGMKFCGQKLSCEFPPLLFTDCKFRDMFPCKTFFLIVYLVNFSLKNVHDKITSAS